MKTAFLNGCFDLLVVRHVRLILYASTFGRVVISLNSDASVRRLKGMGRPIIGEQDRAEILRGIKGVDEVFINDDDSPLYAILKYRPDYLIKGDDYHESEIIGAEEVKSWGGQVVRFYGSEGSMHSSDLFQDLSLIRDAKSGMPFTATASQVQFLREKGIWEYEK